MALALALLFGVVAVAFFTFLMWVSISNQIRTLNDRVKDYLLIAPAGPGVQGTVSARLFEAMKEVCETAKAHADAHDRYQNAQKNSTALVSDVSALQTEWWEAGKKAEIAVAWLRKVEGTHEIIKR